MNHHTRKGDTYVRRHVKASPTRSDHRPRRLGLRRIARGVFALRADGSGAPSHAPARASRGRRLAFSSLLALLTLALLAPMASAVQYQRPFEGSVGSVEQPTFEKAEKIAVDKDTGDVLVGVETGYSSEAKLYRYHSDGTPAPFAALGTNVIDGKAGSGGKPCSEEPASCDKTPGELFRMYGSQITVDNSGGLTDGDIVVTEQAKNFSDPGLVYFFNSDGKYLGELSAANFEELGSPCGLAVDSSGLYVAQANHIDKFVPTANPPVNSDFEETFRPDVVREGLCRLASGTGSSAGSLFAAYTAQDFSAHVAKIDEADTSEYTTFIDEYTKPTAVDPTTGNLVALQSGSARVQAGEFAGGGATGGAPLSSMAVEQEDIAGVNDFAADAAGNILVVYSRFGYLPTTILIYGQPAVVPTVEANQASKITGSQATLTGTVNPTGLEVTDCFFEYGETNSGGFTSYNKTAPCEGEIPTDSEPHPVHATIEELTPNGQKYSFRLAATNENGTERSTPKSLVTAHTVATEAAAPIARTSARLNGTVLPEGLEYSECYFEWGLRSAATYEHKTPCYPPAPAIEPGFDPQSVYADIEGLQENTTYRFQLVATNSEGTQMGGELYFSTRGLPEFTEIRARDASQDAVTLEAKINPNGFGTSYHFEWGTSSGYGHEVPAGFQPYIGSGAEPVKVTATIPGLSAGSTYHYRVVADNAVGTAASPDQRAQTLNSCGLPDGRCFELVSPRDAGPVAVPGESRAGTEMKYQVAPGGGALSYFVEFGFPDATTGAEVLYLGKRGSERWSSTQVSPPINAENERSGVGSGSGWVRGLNGSMSCGIVESYMPLTDDPGALETREEGGSNLYRRDNGDGSYEAVTALPSLVPLEAILSQYELLGMSRDCETAVFETEAVYPGVPGEGNQRTYEWRDGSIHNLGLVPGPSGEVNVAAQSPGGPRNVVSEDGSRVFFVAERQTSPNPSEVGKQAVFVREDGGIAKDVSTSQGPEPSGNATFQWATADGSRVFFTANAGLTAESSESGTDLYEYDVDTETLTDLSATSAAGGAQVKDFVAASSDGSSVYFLAQGELVPGNGKSLSANQNDGTYSLYGEVGGEFSYVGTVRSNEAVGLGGESATEGTTSSLTAGGRYLVFQTSENLTAYDSHGATMAYLYDAAKGNDGTVCVSCRQDGLPPAVGAKSNKPLFNNFLNPLSPPSFVALRDGQPLVFFRSEDRLAPDAIDGDGGTNVYEWANGQVFLVDKAPPGIATPGGGRPGITYVGTSRDGSDMYFSTKRTLTWEDGDDRGSVYDARIGGGYAEPPAPPEPCDPNDEGSCQGESDAGPGSVPDASSKTYSGAGNVVAPVKPRNRCRRPAVLAKRWMARFIQVHRQARRARSRRAHRVMARRAHRVAVRVKAFRKGARRCHAKQRSNNDRRAGK